MSRFSSWLLVVFAGLTLAGCGSNENDFIISNGSANLSPSRQGVAGKLFLGAGIPDVPITVETLDGQVLATTVTSATGGYMVRQPFPDNFRVVARLSQDLAFFREMRNFNAVPSFAAITIPTTIASLRAQASPGTSLSQIESDVRVALALPTDYFLPALVESASAPFSHIAFLAEAQAQGGLPAFMQTLAANPNREPVRFLLREQTLDTEWNALDSRVANTLTRFTSQPRVRLGTRRVFSRTFQGGEVNTASVVRAQALVGLEAGLDVVSSVLSYVGKNVGAAIIADLTNSGFTWISTQIEGHFGDTTQLDQIITTLDEISDDITTILQELTIVVDSSLTTANNDIQSYQNQLVQAYDAAKGTNNYFNDEPDPTPSTLPPQIGDYLGGIGASSALSDLQSDVATIQLYMTGNTTIPSATPSIAYPPIVVNPSGATNYVTQQRDAVLDTYGITKNSDQHGDMPVRSAYLLDQSLGAFEGYARSQILGAHLAGEAAHQSPSPGSSYKQAKALADNVAISLLNTRAQLPAYPIDDNFFVDLENGLVWYLVSEGAAYDPSTGESGTNDSNEWWAEQFSPDGTTGWRLPFWDEIRSLQDRGIAAGGGSTSDTEGGLDALGFDFSGALSVGGRTSDPILAIADWRYDSGLFGSNEWAMNDSGLSWQASNTSPIEYDDSVQRGFLMVRTLPSSPCYDIDPPTITSGTNNGTWPSVMVNGGISSKEAASLGVLTSLTPSLTTGSNNTGTVVPTGTFTSNTGGSFQVGGNNRSTDYTRTESPTAVYAFSYFQTNDNQSASVSNYQDSYGQLIAHVVNGASLTTTITFAGLGYGSSFPTVVTGTATNNWSSQPTITLEAIQISPYNSLADLLSAPGLSPVLVATGFYSDGTAVDISTQVTFTATYIDVNGNEVPAPGVTVSTGGTHQLIFDTTQAIPENLIIRAAINQTANNIVNIGSAQTKMLVVTN
jgi:hypothetical protein